MSDVTGQSIRIVYKGKNSVVSYDHERLSVVPESTKAPLLEVPLKQVLWSEHSGSQLHIHVLAKKGKKVTLNLVNVSGKLTGNDIARAPEWVENLMVAAYARVKRRRKLRVLINPAGGPGKARSIFLKKVGPILRAAQCELDITYTERRNHAQDICRDLSLDFDGVICLSGDGTLHEIFNGFAQHQYPMRAFRIPVAPIPTGSGNATSLNLLGLKEGFDVATAALNAIKGEPMELDLFSMTIGSKRIITFMTQCVGLTADLDLGTEHLRWMGDTRFVYGFIREALKFNSCPVKVAIKVAERDKETMVHRSNTLRSAKSPIIETPVETLPVDADLTDEEATRLPALQHTGSTDDDWIEFDKPITYVYAGQGPYVSRDLMQFPVSLPNDGHIDVVIQERTSRGALLKSMDGAERGTTYWMPMQHYYKALAYRITRAKPEGLIRLSVDGEGYDFEDFTVEVHQGLGRLLSMQQQYVPHFKETRPTTQKSRDRRSTI